MSDIVPIINRALEAGRFLREAGDATVTKVIRVADLREAEMLIEFAADQADEKADRVLVAMVFNRGAGNVAQLKTRGGAFQSFVDRSGPLVVIVPEKTFRHLECDAVLWRRVNLRETAPPPPPRVETKAVPAVQPADTAEMLAGCLSLLIVVGGLGGYAWYRHATRTPPEQKTPAIMHAGDALIATAPPSHPGLARDVMVRVEIALNGRVVVAQAYEPDPQIARAAELAAHRAVFEPDRGKVTTTIYVRFKPR